jgi:Fe-Mn family superoxide dismutase
MPVNFPDLPYSKDALEPYISSKTLEFHHGKHHKGYVEKTNQLIEGTDLADKDLETIIKDASKNVSNKSLFNNAAQAWNHTFFWQCMKTGGVGKPRGKIAEKIDASFGSHEKFAETFKSSGVGLFGSGWVWLILKGDKLDIMQASNADTPIVHGYKPLLVVDVWEHAYYLDYQNRRADFLQGFIDHLVNWDFVNSNLG